MKNKNIFVQLSKSHFRKQFKLHKKEIDYVHKKGLDEIRKHAKDFILKRIAPANIPNDGKQTPIRNHPVFIAQHATATCCRKCIYKWHKIPDNRALNDQQQQYLVALIMHWIKQQIN